MTVTRLQYLPRGGVRVYLDGEAAAVVDDADIDTLQLRRDCEVDEQALQQLQSLAMQFEARRRAAGSLARRSFSQKELHRRLTEKGIESEAARQAVEHYVQRGVVDDASYAMHQAARLQHKGYGRRRIAQELGRRGIDRELRERALEQLAPDREVIHIHLQRKLARVDWADRAQRDRAARALAALGFAHEDIAALLRRLSSEDLFCEDSFEEEL